MATAHVVFMKFVNVDAAGNIVRKEVATTSISDIVKSSQELRVDADPAIPNSAGYPTLKRYIELEAQSNFTIGYISNTMVVTYST